MPYESPLHSVHSLRRDEGSLSLNELLDLYTSLPKKVEGLESELKQTKQTYSTALIKLILRVKKLEQIVKASKSRRRVRVVESDDEEDLEDPSKQGRSLIEELDIDTGISLVPPHAINKWRNNDTQIYDLPAERRRSVSTGSGRVSTASRTVSTADDSTASELGSTVGMSMDEELAKKVFEEEQAKSMAEQEEEMINFQAALELQKYKEEHGHVLEESRRIQDELFQGNEIEDDVEKEELKAYLDLVPREEFAMADGSSKNYKIFNEMLDDFDR
ncbi:hypothetical protein Tco_0862745 [Tanacetum coccineum]